jgi:hypothetical protein
MPPSAIVTSEKMGMSPDTPYALDLLQTTGICVVPTGKWLWSKAGTVWFPYYILIAGEHKCR